MLGKNIKTFVMHLALFNLKIKIHLVLKAQIALFIVKKVIILTKYIVFTNIFLK